MRKAAQTTLEVCILIAIIAAGLISMAVYMKRAFQGRLRTALDTVGEPYSPTLTNSTMNTTEHSETEKGIVDQQDDEGKPLTTHETISISNSTREGFEEIGEYDKEKLF